MMKNKKPFFKSSGLGLKIAQGLLLLLLLFLDAHSARAQTASEYKLTWDINVGCQIYSPPKPRDGEDTGLYIDDIEINQCIRVCESSTITYTLAGDLSGTPNVQWTVAGGTMGTVANTATSSSVPVTWDAAGEASITFTMNTPTGGTITKTMCIKIIKKPQANFLAYPMEGNGENNSVIFACVGQPIQFTDTSITNGGSAIVDHYWTFGDQTFSAEQNPTHIYNEPGKFTVELTVTNECGCMSTIKRTVIIKDAGGFEISCASVVCEGNTSTYNLPFNGERICEEYNFDVQGGEMVNPNNGSVTVTWNHVDASGFGIVTFNPNGHCHLECLIPTSIRVPVIQTNGTITGNATICLGQQERYQLPQWPATNFQWAIQGSSPTNPLGQLIPTDQPNEIILQPYYQGPIVLICNYQNTFLHCGGSATYTINVNIPETINGPTNLCVGGTGNYNTVSHDEVDWVLTRNNAVVAGGTDFETDTFNYNFTEAGNYSLTVSGPNVCDHQSISITINPVPPVLLTTDITFPSTQKLCPNAPYTFSVNPVNPNMDYNWTVTGGTPISGANDSELTASFNQTGPNALQVTQQIKNQPGCVSTALNIPITMFTIDANISDNGTTYESNSNDFSSCANTEKTYYAVNSTGAAGLYTIGETYTWSINPSTAGSITSGQGTKVVTVLWNNIGANANPQLVLTITKCTLTIPFTKIVHLIPQRTLTLTANDSCSGSLITMNLSSNMIIPVGTQINWNYGNGDTSTQTIYTATTICTKPYIYYTNPSGPASFVITASLVFPTTSGCTGATSQTKTILITPGPIADISQSGPNIFCNASSINITLTAATASNSVITWYRAPNTALPPGPGDNSSLTITSTLGVGNYFYTVTYNGCTSKSNSIAVKVNGCGQQPLCTLNPYPNISLANLSSCDSLSVQATTSPAPTTGLSYWSVIGPDSSNTVMNISGTGAAVETYTTTINNVGTYHILYKGIYNCTNGNTTPIETQAFDVVVPYLANFTTNVTCGTQGTYSVTLTSTSNFISSIPPGNRNYFYFWSHTSTGPWTAINATSAASTVFDQPVGDTNGDYYFRLVVSEATNTYASCEKISDYMSLAPDPVRNISFQNNTCYNSAVNFSVFPPNTSDVSYLWTFDADSGVPIASLATNTLENPSRVFDELASGLAHNVKVTVVITNRYGCTRTLSKMVPIPARCYYGNISSPTASICKGGSLVLQYTAGSHGDNCAMQEYQWMEGSTQIGASTTPSYTVNNVSGTKFYWVRLVNANPMNCVYNCSGRVTPTYKPMPTLQLSAPSIVCYSGGTATATVGANTTIAWYVDTVLQPNTSTSLGLGNFPIGTHNLSVVATLNNGCSKTISQSFTVKTPPASPSASFDIDCDTYKVTLSATPPEGGTGVLTWSSGTIGNPTTVYHGGPYMVTYNDGSGCPSYAQLDVPNSLDKYLWIFPSGCYTQCNNNLGTLIGPNVSVPKWLWLFEDSVESNGHGLVQPYQPMHPGTYSLSLNNGYCSQVSDPMNLNVIQCKECEFKKVTAEVKCVYNELFQYTMSMIVENGGAPAHGTISVPGNEVMLNPTTFSLNSGYNAVPFTVIPINGFVSGTVHMVLNCTTEKGEICTYEFDVKFDPCPKPRKEGEKMAIAETINCLQLFPNPAHGEVTAQFDIVSDTAALLIYDLTGKQLASYAVLNKKGSINLNIAQLASGVYVVVLKEDGQTTMQKKLVVE